tara:strand:- start:5073 stop:5585 length:513 start_codon:yes stop_codon:yes gene_type:complete
MATENYPSSVLPPPLIKGYQYSEEERILTTSMDNGWKVKRKRFTSIPAIFTFSLALDISSLSYFQAWFAGDIDYGLDWFNMDMAVGAGLLTTHEVRFLENPSYKSNGLLWSVSAKIEATEMALGLNYTSDDLSFIAAVGGVRGFDKAAATMIQFDVSVNTTYPNSGYGQG